MKRSRSDYSYFTKHCKHTILLHSVKERKKERKGGAIVPRMLNMLNKIVHDTVLKSGSFRALTRRKCDGSITRECVVAQAHRHTGTQAWSLYSCIWNVVMRVGGLWERERD